jgi:hypothetical protein
MYNLYAFSSIFLFLKELMLQKTITKSSLFFSTDYYCNNSLALFFREDQTVKLFLALIHRYISFVRVLYPKWTILQFFNSFLQSLTMKVNKAANYYFFRIWGFRFGSWTLVILILSSNYYFLLVFCLRRQKEYIVWNNTQFISFHCSPQRSYRIVKGGRSA